MLDLWHSVVSRWSKSSKLTMKIGNSVGFQERTGEVLKRPSMLAGDVDLAAGAADGRFDDPDESSSSELFEEDPNPADTFVGSDIDDPFASSEDSRYDDPDEALEMRHTLEQAEGPQDEGLEMQHAAGPQATCEDEEIAGAATEPDCAPANPAEATACATLDTAASDRPAASSKKSRKAKKQAQAAASNGAVDLVELGLPYVDEDEGPLLPYEPGADPDGDLPALDRDLDVRQAPPSAAASNNPFVELFGENDSVDGDNEDEDADAAGALPDPRRLSPSGLAAGEEAAPPERRERSEAERARRKAAKAKARKKRGEPAADEGTRSVDELTAEMAAVNSKAAPNGGARGGNGRGGGKDTELRGSEASGGGGVDFVEQLKLLPFLLRANQSGPSQLEVYEHSIPAGPPLRISQFPEGVGCAAEGGQPAWQWRVWDASKAIATALTELEAQAPGSVRGAVALEMGAGAGLASLAAARLGARAVLATDLPRALPLTVHNLEKNGAVALAACPRAKGGVRCPGGHRLKRSVAKTEDHLCNVCGLADPLGGGIDKGSIVHCCRPCDFDVCGGCADNAAAGKWSALPGWFQLQCEGRVEGIGTWQLATPGLPPSDPPDAPPPTMILAPWDLLESGDGANSRRASELVEQCVEHGGSPPSLVLVADLSCSALLVQPLVDSLVALRALMRPGAIALLAHEKREPKVDTSLSVALAKAGLVAEPMRIPDHLTQASPAVGKAKGGTKGPRLQLWRIPLCAPA